MTSLILALYTEGNSDIRFLNGIVQRTAAALIAQHGDTNADVQIPLQLKRPPRCGSATDCIVQVARQVEGYHALIIHADSDQCTRDETLQQRLQPGMQQVASAAIDIHIVPLIAVRMIEAWMLADHEVLLQLIGTHQDADQLHLPRGSRVEDVRDPKTELQRVITDAFRQRSKRAQKLAPRVSDLYEPLGQQASLDRLRQLPAFRQFESDLTDVLRRVHIVK